MFDIDRRLHHIALRNKGIVTRIAALLAGIPVHAIDDRVRAGVLVPLHDGIYRHAAVPYTQDLRDLAAVLACGDDSALSHRSAGARQGYPGVNRSVPEVTTPHTDLPRLDGVLVHRSRRLSTRDVISIDGIRVTTRGRTALDLCAVLPLWITQEIIPEAVIMKVVKAEEIVATLERNGGRGCPGTSDLRSIAVRLKDIELLESVLELRVSDVLDGVPVPRPVRQHPITCADGREVRLDFAWPPQRIALDANGRRWHDTPARRRRTAGRRASILATGWDHLECGWAEAHDAPGLIVDAVLAAHAAADARAA